MLDPCLHSIQAMIKHEPEVLTSYDLSIEMAKHNANKNLPISALGAALKNDSTDSV